MPHRRKPEKGSFGGHFDELVEHFRDERPTKPAKHKKNRPQDERNVHDCLFERAWRTSDPTRDA
jgi:hypothetical protein